MTPVLFRIHWYSIGLVVYRARRAVHALIFLQQSIVQSLRVRYAYRTKRSIIFSYDFRRNVNKRVVSWVSDGEKNVKQA